VAIQKDYKALFARALAASDAELLPKPEDLSNFVLPNAEGLPSPVTDWMWEGYVLRGKLTNIEAKGGGGKSRLLLGIAACLSNGVFPFTYEPEVKKVPEGAILYFSSEDTACENAQTFVDCGGNRKYFIPYNKKNFGTLRLNDEGLTKFEKMIKANGIVMAAFDPILQYLPDFVKSQNDNVAITQFLDDLRTVAESTNAAIFPIRHWAKGTLGKDVEDLAAGGEAWRNGARGQFVLFSHPKNMRNWSQFLVVPGRNTQRVQYGPPFAIQVSTGLQTFLHPKDIDWEIYCEAYPALARRFGNPKANLVEGTRGPKASVLQETAKAILNLLSEQPEKKMYTKDVRETLIKRDFVQRTIYNARDALLKSGQIEDNHGMWTLSATYDPFENDGPDPEGGQQYWQDF
jgi:hypothetical protein